MQKHCSNYLDFQEVYYKMFEVKLFFYQTLMSKHSLRQKYSFETHDETQDN